MRVGVTGNIASGKSTFASVWRDLGCPVVDADAACHKLYKESDELKATLLREFGSKLVVDGEVDRNLLGRIVFNSPDRLPVLAEIVQPYISEEINEQMLKYEREFGVVLYDAPLLIESGSYATMDKTICIVTDDNIRNSRLMSRNNLSREQAQARMDAQLCQVIKSSKCDIVISNNGTTDALKLKASAIYNEILFPGV